MTQHAFYSSQILLPTIFVSSLLVHFLARREGQSPAR
jgi:hypothetical protein